MLLKERVSIEEPRAGVGGTRVYIRLLLTCSLCHVFNADSLTYDHSAANTSPVSRVQFLDLVVLQPF